MANQDSSTQNDFYVYALFRENGIPFYVGKGKGDRWKHHERPAHSSTRSHKNKIIRHMQARGEEVIKIKIHDGLTEVVAHRYEMALIAAIGRGKHGPLVNLTEGGEGVAGFRFPGRKLSPEHITKRSASRRGKRLSAEARANIGNGARGRKKSPEECARISAGKLGKKQGPRSAETRAKIAASLRGRKRHTGIINSASQPSLV